MAASAPPSADRTEGEPGWQRNFVLLVVSQMIAMAAFSSALPFLPLYIQTLGVPDPSQAVLWAGSLTFAGSLTMALMAPVWGTLADRYGRKPMVTRSLIGGGMLVGLMSLAGDVRHLLALRTLHGGFSGTVAASRVLVAGIVPPKRLGQTLGYMATAAFVGSSAGPLLGGFVSDHFGFRAAFLMTGTMLVIAGIGVALFVRERFVRPTGEGARFSLRANVRVLVDMPQVRAVIIAMFAVQVGQTAVSPVMPLFVGELSGGESTASTVGLILGVTAISSAAAASVGGRLGDQWGHRRVLAVAALAAGLLYLPQALVQSPWQLLALRALLGVFIGAIMPVGMAIVGLLTPPESRGWVFGLSATATSLGNALGPLFGAGVASLLGFRAAFVFTAIALTTAGVVIALLLRAPAPTARSSG